MEKIAISIDNLTLSYNGKPALLQVGLMLPLGKFTGIIGPNGGGKSSLFKAIMGVVHRESGRVQFLGKSLKSMRKKLAYVPQRQTVDWNFPARVYDVVMMGRYANMGFLKWAKKSDKRIVKTCLEQVDLLSLADRQIGELSGGQLQRVFLARALAQQAEIYLLDEPFAGVDFTTETLILQILHDLTAENKTVVVIHHNVEVISRCCDYLVLLNQRVHGAGPPKEVLIPDLLQKTYGKPIVDFQ